MSSSRLSQQQIYKCGKIVGKSFSSQIAIRNLPKNKSFVNKHSCEAI